MTRENFVIALLLLAWGFLTPAAGAAERKLVWTYPCTFEYNDAAKTPYENKISSAECDFIHAGFGDNSVKDFNDYTPAAQKAFLDSVDSASSNAFYVYCVMVKKILQETDPATIPLNLAPKDRLQKLMEFQSVLTTTTFASFKPFQWEKIEPNSYLDKQGGVLPPSWDPYVDPIRARSHQLNLLIQPLQGQMASDATQKVTGAINKMERLKKLSLTAEELVARLWGGPFKSPDGLASPDQAEEPWYGHALAPVPSMSAAPYSPRLAPPAPLPQTAQAQAKYGNFNRGFEQGTERVTDEASIAWWHYTGQTRTVGDPVGKSNLVFQQKGGSCALGSQFQALEARGKIPPANDDTAMRAFVQQAQADGHFVEIRDKAGGTYGGTSSADLDKMLTAYNVPHTVTFMATQQDLDEAVRHSGDAIVTVEAGAFWNDPKVKGGHAVYVTGAEVDKAGKIVGYYFNDTGTGEGARFVSAADFDKSWTHGLITLSPANGK